MDDDGWLDCWLPLLAQHAAGRPLLELGCGAGRDTAALAAAGHAVVAIDRSAEAVACARASVPAARVLCQDLRAPWPQPAGGFGAIVASLSLHYFTWTETVALMERIHAGLAPHGLLVCRLNSTRDHHFGASGHPQIEANYFDVDGHPKRFFDRASIDALFSTGWRMLHRDETVIDRYDRPKAIWELVAEAVSQGDA